MAYLRNNTVNLLNLHYGLHAVAQGAGGVFYAVFLLKAGVPTPLVLGAIAFVLAGRFCLRPLVLVLGKRTGLKPLAAFGAVAGAFQYLLLPHVHGADASLLVWCAVSSFGETFYWTSYHAYFAALGDEEHRGHQVSAREALASIVAILAPLAGGWALTTLGPEIAFGATAAAQALSALPFLGTPNVKVAAEAPSVFRTSMEAFLMFAADGWISAGYLIVWQISLFLTLGESFAAYGGAMAVAAVAGAVSGLLLGRHIDSGGGVRAAWIGFAAIAGTIVSRALAHGPAQAIAANALGALVGCLYVPTMMTAVYNQSKRSACVLRFHVAAEGAWDLGCGTACLTSAGLIALGAPLWAAMLLALTGATGTLTLMWRYYLRTAAG